MRIVVTGATGLLGSRVVSELRDAGDAVVVLSRSVGSARAALGSGVEVLEWADPAREPAPGDAFRQADGVVNLLGEPIAQRWSEPVKRRIRASRVLGTRNLVASLRALPSSERPRVLVSGSATGLYGPRGDERLDEDAAPGEDFLARVVSDWEAEAQAAQDDGLRVVLARTGIVLSSSGGALAKMLPPFRLGVGGPVAGGRQFLPWIHLDDVAGVIVRALRDEAVQGPVNVAAPEPVTNREFSQALGRALHRPALVPVPKLAIQLLYGEMSSIVLTGQRAVPRRLQELGYGFGYPDLDAALADVLR